MLGSDLSTELQGEIRLRWEQTLDLRESVRAPALIQELDLAVRELSDIPRQYFVDSDARRALQLPSWRLRAVRRAVAKSGPDAPAPLGDVADPRPSHTTPAAAPAELRKRATELRLQTSDIQRVVANCRATMAPTDCPNARELTAALGRLQTLGEEIHDIADALAQAQARRQ
ncbi:MAG: hypothetical protein R2712_02160 [Vicinamibacterales bacterium]